MLAIIAALRFAAPWVETTHGGLNGSHGIPSKAENRRRGAHISI